MTCVTEGIVIGSVSGVIAGVVVSILLWIKHRIDICWNRRKEIKRLKDIIEDFRSRIYTAEDMNFEAVDVLRRAYFDDMATQLYNALNRGSPNLVYDETQGIRDAIFPYTHLYPDVRPNIGAYNDVFSKLEELKWLNLSARAE